jgi:tRNA-specific 2-thiouridylase
MRTEQGVPKLLRGIDPVKDQTYFLSHMSREQLARCVFPLGVLHKREVRELAAQYDLANQQRPDSQGICFLGKIKFRDFVKFHLGEVAGPIVHMESDQVLGEHQGYWFHTVGQRKGLGLSGGPWFVVGKNPEKNIVYVSHQEHYLERAKDRFLLRQANWINAEPDLRRSYQCKVRHGAKLYSCTLFKQDNQLGVVLDQADAGIAPGQFCVVYDSMECLGGGIIEC